MGHHIAEADICVQIGTVSVVGGEVAVYGGPEIHLLSLDKDSGECSNESFAETGYEEKGVTGDIAG